MNNIARFAISGLNTRVTSALKVSLSANVSAGVKPLLVFRLLVLVALLSTCSSQSSSAQADTCIIDLPNPITCLQHQFKTGFSKDKAATSKAQIALLEMMNLLKGNEKLSSEELLETKESIKKQIADFRNDDKNSPAEVQSFLRTMVGAKNFYRRRLAVRFLVGEQNMDNVPSLIYAVSDPDFRIAFEAHQGLRLLSRKIDSMQLSRTTFENAQLGFNLLTPETEALVRSEFKTMETRWSAWFLGIRPEAKLFKLNDPEFSEVSK